ncbi:MAG: hypothetical protein HWD59_02245 [Coxiellaceae bacterium]|nr:MAG: hypothetical protein HWD59_02245 [Coxiellaceae bacterium]
MTALTFNQDGNLISGHNDGKILTWRHKNYFCLSQENFAINSLNLLNKNSLVATSAQGDIKFYSGNSCFRWLRQQPALPKPLLVQINDDTIMTLNAANQLIFYQTNPFKEIRTINNPIEIYPQQNPTSVLICKLQDNLFAIANENKLAVFQVVAADCRLCLIHQWSLETHIHSLLQRLMVS